jgi:hypothetical protein
VFSKKHSLAHHGRGLILPDQRKPTTTLEGRVSWENQPKTSDLAPKNNSKKRTARTSLLETPQETFIPLTDYLCSFCQKKKKEKKESKT